MYKSPIAMNYETVKGQIEDGVMKAVTKVGIDVDKDELIKALQYDRDQYEKGYEDGIKDRVKGRWKVAIYKCGKERYTCDICGCGNREGTDFCPNCGARMKGADDGEN